MGAQRYNFILLLIFVFVLHVSVRAEDDPCANVECGKGTCIPHKGILGYDCDCDSGWSKYEFAGFTFPPCIIPNCTMNTDCGNSNNALLPPLPPPAPPAPPFNLFNPCNLIWCGDGTCVANGTGYYCQCYEGSTNALNLTGLACFKPCAFGVDCYGVSFGPHIPPPPSSSNGTLALPPPPPGPPPKGSNNVSKCSRSCEVFNVVLLSAAFLAFFL